MKPPLLALASRKVPLTRLNCTEPPGERAGNERKLVQKKKFGCIQVEWEVNAGGEAVNRQMRKKSRNIYKIEMWARTRTHYRLQIETHPKKKSQSAAKKPNLFRCHFFSPPAWHFISRVETVLGGEATGTSLNMKLFNSHIQYRTRYGFCNSCNVRARAHTPLHSYSQQLLVQRGKSSSWPAFEVVSATLVPISSLSLLCYVPH